MAKYSYELKKVVDACLNGESRYRYPSYAYQLDTKDIRTWVNNYCFWVMKA